MGYISNLSPSNSGLLIQVLSQASEANISLAQQQKIRKALVDKVDGGFDFMLYRDPDEEYDSDSD